MTLTWSDLYNDCISEVGGLDKRVVLRKLYWAAQEFCRRSEIWRHVQTQSVTASAKTYTLSTPSGVAAATVKRIAGAWYGSESNRRQDGDMIDPSEYEFTYPLTLTLYDAYTGALTNGLTTECVFVPSMDEHVVSQQIMDQWGVAAFIPGAIGEILAMAEEQWTDLSRAQQHRFAFRKAINNAISEVLRRNKGGDIRVVPRWAGR